MKKKIAYFYFAIIGIFLPLVQTMAQGGGGGSAGTIPNPIAAPDFQTFIKKVLDVVLQIGVPVAAIALVYSGFLFVKARGNAQELETAKKAFVWTVLGVAILLGAWLFATVIDTTIRNLK